MTKLTPEFVELLEFVLNKGQGLDVGEQMVLIAAIRGSITDMQYAYMFFPNIVREKGLRAGIDAVKKHMSDLCMNGDRDLEGHVKLLEFLAKLGRPEIGVTEKAYAVCKF